MSGLIKILMSSLNPHPRKFLYLMITFFMELKCCSNSLKETLLISSEFH